MRLSSIATSPTVTSPIGQIADNHIVEMIVRRNDSSPKWKSPNFCDLHFGEEHIYHLYVDEVHIVNWCFGNNIQSYINDEENIYSIEFCSIYQFKLWMITFSISIIILHDCKMLVRTILIIKSGVHHMPTVTVHNNCLKRIQGIVFF